MYQWGALRGYNTIEQFPFTSDAYRQQGLDSISSDLTAAQDAAAVYYGNNSVRIPTQDQLRELMENTDVTYSNSVYTLKSRVNGNSLKIHAKGTFTDNEVHYPTYAIIWSRTYAGSSYARRLQIEPNLNYLVDSRKRYSGVQILPVKSS